MKGAGEGIIMLGLLIWMSATVGPWWVGLVLFLLGCIANLAAKVVKAEKEKKA